MDKEKIAADIDQTLNEVIQLVTAIDEDVINTVPFENSWTAGQAAQHVFIVGSGFADLIYGRVKATDRQADRILPRMKADFENFNLQMIAAPAVVPPAINYCKDDLISNLMHIKSALKNAVNSLDLTMTGLTFEVPVYGEFTRLEAIYFVIYHTQRHIHQLKNIQQKLKQIHKPIKN